MKNLSKRKARLKISKAKVSQPEKNNKTSQKGPDTEQAKPRTQTCKAAFKTRQKKYQKLKIPSDDERALDVLSGCNRVRCAEPTAADLRLLFEIRKLFVREAERLFERSTGSSFNVYHATFLNDERVIGLNDDLLGVRAEVDKIQKVIKNYSNLSAIGRGEIQPIRGFERGSKDIHLHWHYHVLLFGCDQDGRAEIVKRAKGFQAHLTRKPILIKKG